MSRPLGVGIIGAGPVTQAIHLPTLATLADRLQVRHVMDVDAGVAAAVADRVGARASTTVDQLLADDDVDVVAVCSPHQFHADQVAAAAAAGKRGVLCEKPLATTVEEAQRIADVSAAAHIPVVVGAMHAYDPAVVASLRALRAEGAETRLVHVRTYLPANEEMVDLATDLLPSRPPALGPDVDPLEADVARLRSGILGLATHDLPLVRSLLPEISETTSAALLRPFGYELAFRWEDRSARLVALMPGRWQEEWTLDAWGSDHHLHLAFPPSYVLAGSTVATLRTATGSRGWRYPANGYQTEWLHLADVVTGRAELAVSAQEAVTDLLYALQLADGAEKLLREAA